MNKFFYALFSIGFLLGGLQAGPAFAQTITERQKIEYLVTSIETMQNATFIRNGSEYDAERAAAHLRLKLRSAGDRVKTAEEFIDQCATASSFSGKKYQIKFRDGRTVDSATFLRDKLAQYQASPEVEPPTAKE